MQDQLSGDEALGGGPKGGVKKKN